MVEFSYEQRKWVLILVVLGLGIGTSGLFTSFFDTIIFGLIKVRYVFFGASLFYTYLIIKNKMI